MKKLIVTLIMTACFSSTYVNANPLFSLENLERERATLIDTLMSTNISEENRQQMSFNIIRRLTDIERMVLRDDRIAASNSTMAHKAFERYELTFLVHAGSEAKELPVAHWLTELKLSSNDIMTTRVANR